MANYQDFERWWESTAPFLLQVARMFSQVAAADIVQEVAIMAVLEMRRADNVGKEFIWESEHHFRNWARQRVRWLGIDYLRREARFAYIENIDAIPSLRVEDRSDEEQDNRQKQILAALTKLPKRQQIVLGEYLKGKSTHSVAEALGISEATVRSLQRFARQRIVELLEKEGSL